MKAGETIVAEDGQLAGKRLLLMEQHGMSWRVRLLDNADGETMGVMAGAEFWWMGKHE